METIELHYSEIAFGLVCAVWAFSTYRCAGSVLGFMHILSDATRLKIFEFSDPVAHETLRTMGEQKKTLVMLPMLAFRLMVWSLVWVGCLAFMFGFIIFKV